MPLAEIAVTDPLVETWEIHDRINLYLLRALKPTHLELAPPTRGRTVGETFAHLHNVRLMWLKAASPARLKSLEKLEKDGAADRARIETSLRESGAAIAALVGESLEAGGKLKGFKPHVHAFVGYLVSHESHHRGQIMLALKHGGAAVPKTVAYGLWEWGSR